MKNPQVRVFCADARHIPLADKSVHLIITSPPYYNKRDYGVPPSVWGGNPQCEHTFDRNGTCPKCLAWFGTLGNEPNVEQFCRNLADCFDECYRVLRDDGTMWVNIQDSYGDNEELLRVPSKMTEALIERGWHLRARLPWFCVTKGMEHVIDRPRVGHEDLLMFFKSDKIQYWSHPVKRGVREQPTDGYVWTHRPSGTVLPYKPKLSDKLLEKLWKHNNLWHGFRYHYDHSQFLIQVSEASIPADMKTYKPKVRKYKGQTYKMLGTSDNFLTASGGITKFGEPLFKITGRVARTVDLGIHALKTISGYLENVQDAIRNGGMIVDMEGEPLAIFANPEGFKGDHFATFSRRLIEPMLRVSKPVKVCPTCQAPYQMTRIEHTRDIIEEYKRGRKTSRYRSLNATKSVRSILEGISKRHITEHLAPTCSCPFKGEADLPSVLDPFSGSGSVGTLAKELGFNFYGVELKEENAKLSETRLKETLLGTKEFGNFIQESLL